MAPGTFNLQIVESKKQNEKYVKVNNISHTRTQMQLLWPARKHFCSYNRIINYILRDKSHSVMINHQRHCMLSRSFLNSSLTWV